MRALFSLKSVLLRTQPSNAMASTVSRSVAAFADGTPITPTNTAAASGVDVGWRESVLHTLESTGMSACRANATSLQQFVTLYRALKAAGARFLPADSDADDGDADDGEGNGGSSSSDEGSNGDGHDEAAYDADSERSETDVRRARPVHPQNMTGVEKT